MECEWERVGAPLLRVRQLSLAGVWQLAVPVLSPDPSGQNQIAREREISVLRMLNLLIVHVITG